MKVLIVDDLPANRLALRTILEDGDYELVEASDGQEALRELLTDDFAAVLLDVRMPGMDGFELARLIRGRERTRETPVLFVTAEAPQTQSMLEAYGLGAVDYLIKPLEPKAVVAKVAVFANLFRARLRVAEQGRELLAAEHERAELRFANERLVSERRYRNLAEAVPHLVFTTRPDGTLDYFNQRWLEVAGEAPTHDAAGWLSFLHEDDLPDVRQGWDAALQSHRAFEFEARLRVAATGDYRWHLGRVLPERDGEGGVVSWLGTLTDIEHQKRAQRILAEFKGTLDAVADAVFIFDPLGWRLRYLNFGASALLGLSEEQLRQMRTLDLLPEFTEEQFQRLLEDLKRAPRKSVAIETSVRRSDTKVPVELSLQHIGVDGGRLVGIGRDITERKRAEAEREQLYREALDAVAARDEFLSVASHELKTPLTSLRLHLEGLRRRLRVTDRAALPEPVADKLKAANRQIERLALLIEELLDVSRLRVGVMRIQPTPGVDLGALVQDVVERLAGDLRVAGCKVQLQFDGPVRGTWDPVRLDQVVTNLLTNAMKFAPGAPIDISLHAADGHAELAVRDHGIGIPPELRDRIFGRFERGVSTRNYGGLGLGLYIARQVVVAHGGTIRVDNDGIEGHGARFVVELPVEPPVTAPDLQPH